MKAAFPKAIEADVNAVLKIVPIGEHEPAYDIAPVFIKGEALHIPYQTS